MHCVGSAAEEKKQETVSSAFMGDLEAAVKLFVEKWQDHPEGANALAQKHEPDLVCQQLRPLVFEEVRLQVDEEMRVLLQNLKVSLHGVAGFQPAQLGVAGLAGCCHAPAMSCQCLCILQYSCSFLCWFLMNVLCRAV